MGTVSAVRTKSGMTSEFEIKKGVRQGCVLSPTLFNLYTEKIFREVEDMKGVSIGGENIVENWFNTFLSFLQCVSRCTNVWFMLGYVDVIMAYMT